MYIPKHKNLDRVLVSHVEKPPVMLYQCWHNIMGTHDVLPLHVGIVMENIMGFLIRCQYCDEKIHCNL